MSIFMKLICETFENPANRIDILGNWSKWLEEMGEMVVRVVVTTSYLGAKFVYDITKWHFGEREKKNGQHPSYNDVETKGSGWTLLPKEQSRYHDNGQGNAEKKYIHPDGREAVFDGDTLEPVTDPKYIATYNYVKTKGWVRAGKLCTGDRLSLRDGGNVVVSQVWKEKLDEAITVYNFEAADFHTYFVGINFILVHNVCRAAKKEQLPTAGKIRYVPPKGVGNNLPKTSKGFIDRFDNVWVRGQSRTIGEPFEWDVQLSRRGKAMLAWLSRDGSHLNVSLKGRITHK